MTPTKADATAFCKVKKAKAHIERWHQITKFLLEKINNIFAKGYFCNLNAQLILNWAIHSGQCYIVNPKRKMKTVLYSVQRTCIVEDKQNTKSKLDKN